MPFRLGCRFRPAGIYHETTAARDDPMGMIRVPHLRFLRDLRATKKPADHPDHADFGAFSVSVIFVSFVATTSPAEARCSP
jgi:hypothetical protein